MKRATSIQYIKLNKPQDIEDLALEYFNWLPTLFSGLINVRKGAQLSSVEICFFSIPLLVLKRLSGSGRIEFEVVGGLLSKNGGSFSFELSNAELITSLRDFSPRLPWPIYRITQYPFHDLVMFLYSQHLKTLR